MAGKYEYENLAGKYEYEYENLAGKAGLVEGLASSPHHLSNEDSLPAPGVSTIIGLLYDWSPLLLLLLTS